MPAASRGLGLAWSVRQPNSAAPGIEQMSTGERHAPLGQERFGLQAVGWGQGQGDAAVGAQVAGNRDALRM